ncbi:hypothetical protein FOPG_15469 [Fusarium oxysporum f. sp. conglutinans race 2 54008]|nr:hypothetical protein FOPG_15469 [Fusarium oxysporum f. sp. conglutinans race 2 54008]
MSWADERLATERPRRLRRLLDELKHGWLTLIKRKRCRSMKRARTGEPLNYRVITWDGTSSGLAVASNVVSSSRTFNEIALRVNPQIKLTPRLSEEFIAKLSNAWVFDVITTL